MGKARSVAQKWVNEIADGELERAVAILLQTIAGAKVGCDSTLRKLLIFRVKLRTREHSHGSVIALA